MNAEVFVIVPAYNEAPALRETVAPLISSGYSIVLVDDGSNDATEEVARSLPVHFLRHPINLGQGAALQTGMAYALARGARYIVHFDADGQHQPSDIISLLAPIRAGEADVALGSRFLRPEDIASVPWRRRLLLRGGIIVNGLMTGVWLSDAHNGFRAFSREAAAKIELRDNRQAHASEILAQIRRARLRIIETPTRVMYTAYSRAKGQSGWNALNVLFDLVLGNFVK